MVEFCDTGGAATADRAPPLLGGGGGCTVAAVSPSPAVRRPRLRALVAAGMSLLGFAVVGYAILRFLEGAAVAERLRTISPGWLLLALLAWSLSIGVQTLRLRALVPASPRPPLSGFALVILGSNAVHLALPGPVAELGAAWALRQRYGVPMPSALAAALLARVLALAIFGLATLGLWPLVADRLPPSVSSAVWPLAISTGLLGAGLLGLLARPSAVAAFAAGLADRLGRSPPLARYAERLGSRLRWWARCFAAVGELPLSRWAEAAALSVLNLLVLTGSALLTFRALGLDAALLGTLFMQALTAVASVAGLLVPGGLGAVEVLVVLLFPLYAEGTTADAVFAALALRSVHLVTLVIGIPAMSWLIATLPDDPVERDEALAGALAADLDSPPGPS